MPEKEIEGRDRKKIKKPIINTAPLPGFLERMMNKYMSEKKQKPPEQITGVRG